MLARCNLRSSRSQHSSKWISATRRKFSVGDDWSNLETKAGSIIKNLVKHKETVGVAETATGGLISAALWSSPLGSLAFKGAGVRLAYGISREADAQGVAKARDYFKDNDPNAADTATTSASSLPAVGAGWPLVYEEGDEHSETGSAVHALELAHSAKLNLGTSWGIGESSIPGPDAHRRTGMPPGMGFVAVAGPTKETTGVLKLNEGDKTRGENMARFTNAALDLMAHLQSKR
mmetsp:Transcript_1493/g.1611  ORF Transcript_1493/g.1611 Transcript_1493/m.1611 type:complete len:234 (-) Transcript_1493:420-1121(-)|eukprot:CAMPEP_0198252172 /NCGR_PEP_ID=MMETSP1447-20131203/2737_1 /TAXON_ID=420782 /ORGANISM="Chaetoceros dichaeta, Strain CCMP1751" /LENGTH=233 /DNA_ID=CAMNT_0043937341 /DNA_START=48 /DNA_END=749 /DNA_ORIENTATION=+